MQCIICKENKSATNFSKEHIFPDSIGGNITLDCVCKICNDILGSSIDSKLTNHEFVQLIRLALKIPGKSGKIPNPLYESYIAGTQEKIRYILDNFGNPKELQQVSSKVDIEFEDDGALNIHIEACTKPGDEADRRKLIDITNKKLKRKGLTLLSEEQEKKILNAQPISSERPLIHKQLKIDTIFYKRAIIKIAYELAYYWLGSDYLNDNMGELLRLIIYQDFQKERWHNKSIDFNIDLYGEKSWFPYLYDDHYKNNIHVGSLLKVNNYLRCYIKIFDIFQGVITISNDASLYPNFVNKLIAINSQKQTSEQFDLEYKF
ncbi:MAG: HNH endonuclease [Nostoc sp.]|uniref:HNH endonuclease n=1 Tax=Nostoc sp. TaxID=1180 RepID=UPI002FF76193